MAFARCRRDALPVLVSLPWIFKVSEVTFMSDWIHAAQRPDRLPPLLRIGTII